MARGRRIKKLSGDLEAQKQKTCCFIKINNQGAKYCSIIIES